MFRDRYELGDVVAVQWNRDLATLFPRAPHHGCRQMMRADGDRWVPFDPPRCADYHCPRCGAPCNMMGAHR